MTVLLIAIAVALVAVAAWIWWHRRESDRRLVEAHSIVAEELHRLLAAEKRPRVFDVRQPLDLLAYSEIIPGSERIAPKEILAGRVLIPKDEVSIVYCTCPGDETAREIVKRALALDFAKIRILKGGLAAWKEKGYPVERYETAFHLDTPV
ncbi:rhodanese-like domain-containing protein [Granulicella arctica]|uniref:Rhodanese-related sulfurtransferase n=1 Tax=Granulicella arctica TaxID=940613 RepID=A0A7Y9TR47_9BACT|nr:rhodanese-like domain-containing protein [Granulicella arctica]NYF77878.1 rhodanese-related sulfurtransferase [Granulicella arctica]